ncbi:MAG: response regulator, partial [Pseudomonadales bacterium]|nr:response regulator [Pseudomonadales bacterium]
MNKQDIAPQEASNIQPLLFLVEDDIELSELTADYLSGFGFRIETESDGASAVQRILQASPDLIILDVMLPGKDGVDICRELRAQLQTPILMLTARTEQIDQILGLEMGADDYVCKPAEPRLLLARIKALLRRAQLNSDLNSVEEEPQQFYKFDHIEIDNSGRRVKIHDQEIE